MRSKLAPSIGWFAALIAVFIVCLPAHADNDELSLQAQLIWGTNDDAKPSNPKLKPLAPSLADKLKDSPFKWKNYYEVNWTPFKVAVGEEKTVPMSKNCQIRVKNLGNSQVEMQLLGKGQRVGKITQALPKGQLLITGGNAENSTAWFVVLRQLERSPNSPH